MLSFTFIIWISGYNIIDIIYKLNSNSGAKVKQIVGAEKLTFKRIYLNNCIEPPLLYYGNIGTRFNPAFSSSPNIIFMFCTAWPAAPLTRLSIAPIMITLLVLGSIFILIST